MPNITNNITVEGLTNTLNFRGALTTQATSAGTLTLSLASAMNQEFTGSTSGQIVNLGVATNYSVGHEWWLYNESSTFISIRNNAGTELVSLAPSYRIRVILANNATSAGVWILGVVVASSAGGTLTAMFASTAASVSNKFLDTENIAASDTLPAVSARSSVLNLVTYSNASLVSSGTIELYINGILTLTTPFTTTAQTFTSVISVAVMAGDKLSCKIGNGAVTVSKPLVKYYSS